MTYIDELMTVLAEECAEVIQVACKIKRFGVDKASLDALVQELGDVQCMIEMCHEADYISYADLDEWSQKKREKLKRWSVNLK